MHKVLIIEDAVELAEVIQATLETMDIKARHETHGDKGLAAYKEMKPDLILLDIALPDIKGWKLLDQLKTYVQEDPELEMPKIVVISAYGDPANRLMGKLQEVTRYLVKPFTPDEVERVVSLALGLRKEKEGIDAKPLPELPPLENDPLVELLGIDTKELAKSPDVSENEAASKQDQKTETPQQAEKDAKESETTSEMAAASSTPSDIADSETKAEAPQGTKADAKAASTSKTETSETPTKPEASDDKPAKDTTAASPNKNGKKGDDTSSAATSTDDK